jgi:hypothetical protein
MARTKQQKARANNAAKATKARTKAGSASLSHAPDLANVTSRSACHVTPEPAKIKAHAQKIKLDNARKRSQRGKESIKQLQEKLAHTQEETAQRLAELGSTCAAFHAALCDAQAKSASLSASLVYNSSRASTSCAQNVALLDRLSELRAESKSAQETSKVLELALLKQLTAGVVREDGHR